MAVHMVHAKKNKKTLIHVYLRYYEWLKKGPQRVPHFTRHKDQRLMLFAGLYDSVTLEGEQQANFTPAMAAAAQPGKN
jgi:putative SOS response-associated peptidase YedK